MSPNKCPSCGFVWHKKRSHQHHRFYFAAIEQAFENWPETHDFTPENAEHLRQWLQIKAGYREILGERLNHDDGDVMKMADFVEKCLRRTREQGRYGFIAVHNGSVVMFMAKSIDFKTLDQRTFAPIAQSVFEIIEAETGIKIDALKRESEMA